MFQVKAKLVYNTRLADNYFHCALKAPGIARNAHPGQFVDIRLTDTCEPLLRRPFSIHRVRGSAIEILYEVVGRGTEILSQTKAGEYLDIIGPLGNAFSIRNTQYAILVAGGMGVAPLLFLAEKLRSHHVTTSPRHHVTVLIGGKTKQQILCAREFKEIGCEVKIATEDGSKGFKGRVTGLLRNKLYAIRYTLYAIYACGPKPMLKVTSVLSKKYNIPAQISLEAHMACGIGVCLGCVVKVTKSLGHNFTSDFEYKRVCKEGPVFNADEIVW